MYLYFFIHSQSHPKESLNPQVLCTCWSFPSHTALCSIWIGGTETHEDSSQGASSEFLRNSPRQGEPCHPPLGKIGGGPQHVFPQDTVIPSSKGPARTWKIQPTFYRSKTTNKQTKIHPSLWRCSKCPWGVKWGPVCSASCFCLPSS